MMKLFNNIIKCAFFIALVYLVCKVPNKVAGAIEFVFGWIIIKVQAFISSNFPMT